MDAARSRLGPIATLLLTLAVVLPARASDSVLAEGDLVALVGDSITEQKIYTRFIETYLLACVPELDLDVMQFGWSGETAAGFAGRMENDLYPYEPDVVTLCYGMNDGGYQFYKDDVGANYRNFMQQIVAGLQGQDMKVVVGSAGCVDTATFKVNVGVVEGFTADAYNESLAHLRDIAREVAEEAGATFADVYAPLLTGMGAAKADRGADYHMAGADGVHPWDNGHLIMAYAFLPFGSVPFFPLASCTVSFTCLSMRTFSLTHHTPPVLPCFVASPLAQCCLQWRAS